MKVMKCSTCEKELTENMEIEHCRLTGSDYFCNHKCAMHFYFEYMGSHILDLTDEESIKDHGIYIKNEKLYKT